MVYKEKFFELLELVRSEELSKADIQWKALDLKSEALILEAEQQKEALADDDAGEHKAQSKAEIFNGGRKVK